MLSFFQIDAVQLGQEIAKNIPPPETRQETWIFGLFAISGWVVAVGTLVWMWHKDKQRQVLDLEKIKQESKDKTEDKQLFERSIESMVNASMAMKTQADAINALANKTDIVSRDILEIKLKLDKE